MAGKTRLASNAPASSPRSFRTPDKLPAPRAADFVPEGGWPPADAVLPDRADDEAAPRDAAAALAARLRDLI